MRPIFPFQVVDSLCIAGIILNALLLVPTMRAWQRKAQEYRLARYLRGKAPEPPSLPNWGERLQVCAEVLALLSLLVGPVMFLFLKRASFDNNDPLLIRLASGVDSSKIGLSVMAFLGSTAILAINTLASPLLGWLTRRLDRPSGPPFSVTKPQDAPR